MSFATIRPATDMLFDMLEQGILDPLEVAKQALLWLEDRDVKRLAEVNEYFPYPIDDETEHDSEDC